LTYPFYGSPYASFCGGSLPFLCFSFSLSVTLLIAAKALLANFSCAVFFALEQFWPTWYDTPPPHPVFIVARFLAEMTVSAASLSLALLLLLDLRFCPGPFLSFRLGYMWSCNCEWPPLPAPFVLELLCCVHLLRACCLLQILFFSDGFYPPQSAVIVHLSGYAPYFLMSELFSPCCFCATLPVIVLGPTDAMNERVSLASSSRPPLWGATATFWGIIFSLFRFHGRRRYFFPPVVSILHVPFRANLSVPLPASLAVSPADFSLFHNPHGHGHPYTESGILGSPGRFCFGTLNLKRFW